MRRVGWRCRNEAWERCTAGRAARSPELCVASVQRPGPVRPSLSYRDGREHGRKGVRFRPPLGRSRTAEPDPSTSSGVPPAVRLVNWRAVRRAEHACCCAARPIAAAIMPPTPGSRAPDGGSAVRTSLPGLTVCSRRRRRPRCGHDGHAYCGLRLARCGSGPSPGHRFLTAL